MQSKESLYLSVVSVGELWRGFVLAPNARRIQLEQWFECELLPRVQSRILPVTQSIAKRWGILDAEARLRRTDLNAGDGMIAATALEHAMVVATRNVKDFEKLEYPS